MSAPPVPFVVGAARSGTTLLRLMLDAHPDLAIPPETGAVIPKLIEVSEAPGASVDTVMAVLLERRRWPELGLDAQVVRRRLGELAVVEPRGVLHAVIGAYAERHGKPRWGDKTPRNVLRMRRIGEALPEARFVHMIRDGRDVALSKRQMRWRTESLVEGAQEWAKHVRRGREEARSLRHYLEVRYEDLVADPRGTLERVCTFVDLPWDDAVLDYHRTAADRMSELVSDVEVPGEGTVRAHERAAIHVLTSQPPRTERIGRWRSELGESDRAAVESAVGELLAELGYETRAGA